MPTDAEALREEARTDVIRLEGQLADLKAQIAILEDKERLHLEETKR